MNQNGYIRKIDELGRIVIPKEIRKELKILDNENVLINYNSDCIEIQKYSLLENNISHINLLCNLVTEIFNIFLVVKDKQNIIFSNINESVEYNMSESSIIHDSVDVGCLKLYSDKNIEQFDKLAKFLSRLLSLYL